MAHWRTARSVVGGFDQPSGPHGADTHAELISFPSGSILKPAEIPEPPIHKFHAFERALLGFTVAAALVVALLLLFVEV